MKIEERSLPSQARFADNEHPAANGSLREIGRGCALDSGEGPQNGSSAGVDPPDHDHTEDDAAWKWDLSLVAIVGGHAKEKSGWAQEA